MLVIMTMMMMMMLLDDGESLCRPSSFSIMTSMMMVMAMINRIMVMMEMLVIMILMIQSFAIPLFKSDDADHFMILSVVLLMITVII